MNVKEAVGNFWGGNSAERAAIRTAQRLTVKQKTQPKRFTLHDETALKHSTGVKQKVYTRRAFVIGIVAVLAGTEVAIKILSNESMVRPDVLRRTEGEWSREEVLQLAAVMQNETDYDVISHEGQVLLGNQNGQPTFSQEGRIFTDNPVRLTTVSYIPVADVAEGDAPAEAHFEETEPNISVSLKPYVGQQNMTFESAPSIGLTDIRLSNRHLAQASDFVIELMVAKELANVKIFNDIAHVIANAAYRNYQLTINMDPNIINASLIHAINGNFNGVDGRYLGDICTQFYTIPDYCLGRDRGRLRGVDSKIFTVWEVASERFLESGFLQKTNGKYQWRSGSTISNDLYASWIQTAINIYPVLHR